jgi:hypothetical protein
MTWDVEFEDEFEAEFDDFTDPVKTELLARAKVLAQFGPMLGRPNVDTLNGSEYANMKELRFNADDGVWRVAFAFDPENVKLFCFAVGTRSARIRNGSTKI